MDDTNLNSNLARGPRKRAPMMPTDNPAPTFTPPVARSTRSPSTTASPSKPSTVAGDQHKPRHALHKGRHGRRHAVPAEANRGKTHRGANGRKGANPTPATLHLDQSTIKASAGQRARHPLPAPMMDNTLTANATLPASLPAMVPSGIMVDRPRTEAAIRLIPSMLAGDMVYSPYQWSLKNTVQVAGVGLHGGRAVAMTIAPAPADHGIVFYRTDIDNTKHDPVIKAIFSAVTTARFSTRLSNKDGTCVNTVEHLMSALFAFGIDNALISLDSDEVPILDGSAMGFLSLLEAGGLEKQTGTASNRRIYLQVLQPVVVESNDMTASLLPADFLDIDCQVNYPHPVIGHGRLNNFVSRDFFFEFIAPARTFCLESQIPAMKQQGLARGGSLDNAVVVGHDRVLNPGGLRFPDEFVRHKFLDIVGDLALSPYRLLAKYQSSCGGHYLNNQVLHKLFSDKNNYRLVVLD